MEKEMLKNQGVVMWLVILAGTALCSFVVAGWLILERQGSNILLQKLALARPGVKLSDIREELGQQMREFNELEDVISWGRVKDESFCRGKKSYRFYASTPPCRAIEVYTDSNDVVVFATWRQL